MSVVQRYTDFRSIFAEGGVDPNATMALDGMQPWPVDLLRANAIPEIVLSDDTPDLSPLSLRLTINAGAVDGGAAFDWYVSQRTDDPAKQWFTVTPYSPVRSGTIVVEISAVGMAELGIVTALDVVTTDQQAAAVRFVDVYCKRRSDEAIQRLALSNYL